MKVQGNKHGKMAIILKETSKTAWKMERENLLGQMEIIIMEIGLLTNELEMDNW